MTDWPALAPLAPALAEGISAHFDALKPGMQREVVRHHLETGDVWGAILVLAVSPQIYQPHDGKVSEAFQAGYLAAHGRG